MLLIIHYGFPWRTALVDSVVTNDLLLAACWMVSTILRYYLPYKDRYWYVLFLSITLSLIVTATSRWILQIAYKNVVYGEYALFLTNSFWLRLSVAFLLVGCMTIISVLWYTQEEEHLNRQRKEDAEKLSRDAELYKLRQQLQPHFLFNSLNSISALVITQPEQARKMVHQLSDFLRGTLKEEEQWVTLEEEFETLELYLDIEKVRFGHRLSTNISKSSDCLLMQLPPMLLQPVVENAIKFGLYDTTDDVTITITALNENNMLKIEVINPFDEATSSPRHGTGFGLNSVKRRLYLLFARNDLVETNASGNFFHTKLQIPQLKKTIPV